MDGDNSGDHFRILSIDGGGIRGAFPAGYLDYLQMQIGDNTIQEYFDLIVGTSTGGIIAIALGLEIPTTEIVSLYKTKGSEIFPCRPHRRGLFKSKYSNEPLKAELKRLFGNKLLGDSKCRLCIPTVDVTNGKTLVLKTRHHGNFIHDHRVAAWEAAISTASAPVYFPPFRRSDGLCFIDGGLWANNPVMVGIAEAIMLGHPLDRIKVLSIGTGGSNLHIKQSSGWWSGISKWRLGLIDWAFQMQSMGYSNVAKYLCSNNYLRVDKELPSDKRIIFKRFKLDDHKDVDDMISFASDKGKETFRNVQDDFLRSKVVPFVPIP